MKVVFNGVLESKSGGCVPCGRKRASKKTMVTRKKYYLQSGAEMWFYAGRPTEVSDIDGEHLIGDHGDTFTEVK